MLIVTARQLLIEVGTESVQALRTTCAREHRVCSQSQSVRFVVDEAKEDEVNELCIANYVTDSRFKNGSVAHLQT